MAALPGSGSLALPPSLPALAWARRSPVALGNAPFGDAAAAQTALAALHTLVPAWRVPAVEGAAQAEAAAHVVRHAADRLRRLRMAYGEWSQFDAAAYFDLSAAQTALIVQVVERVRLVHVTFHADLLLPPFQAALEAWATQLLPAQGAAGNAPVETLERAAQAHAAMDAAWRVAAAAIQRTRRLLLADIGFLAANGAEEERARWLMHDNGAAQAYAALPTLTLTADFPLPTARQPGRLRRLHRRRDRLRRTRRRGAP